jgi:hypothetical protein
LHNYGVYKYAQRRTKLRVSVHLCLYKYLKEASEVYLPVPVWGLLQLAYQLALRP